MKKRLVALVLIAMGFTVGIGQGCGSGPSPSGAGGSASGGAGGGAGGNAGSGVVDTSCATCVRAQECCVVVLGPENCLGEQLQECMSKPETERQDILMLCTNFIAQNADFAGCGTPAGTGGSGGAAAKAEAPAAVRRATLRTSFRASP